MAYTKVDNIEEMVVFMDTYYTAFNRDSRFVSLLEGKNGMPSCKIEGTDIVGMPTDDEFWVMLTSERFPLSKEKYSELEKKLGKKHIVLNDEPEKIVYDPEWNYTLKRRGSMSYIGSIRPIEEDNTGIQVLWSYGKLNPQKRESLTVYVFDLLFGDMLKNR
jgi:hypothetical protein